MFDRDPRSEEVEIVGALVIWYLDKITQVNKVLTSRDVAGLNLSSPPW